MGLRLHLGCGRHTKPGYINVDSFAPNADAHWPIEALEYPPGSVERIEAYMVIEHLEPGDALRFAINAHTMLCVGGALILECPDLEKVSRLTIAFIDDVDQLVGGPFGLRGFFAEPTASMTVGDYHKWGYTRTTMAALLTKAGFRALTFADGTSHGFPLRDMRVEAVKGSHDD